MQDDMAACSNLDLSPLDFSLLDCASGRKYATLYDVEKSCGYIIGGYA